MIEASVWWTGVLVWTGFVGLVLWVVASALANAFDAAWFTCRCVFEGGTKNLSARNLWRIWWASFMLDIHSVHSSGGYRIIYPGYGKNVPDEEYAP